MYTHTHTYMHMCVCAHTCTYCVYAWVCKVYFYVLFGKVLCSTSQSSFLTVITKTLGFALSPHIVLRIAAGSTTNNFTTAAATKFKYLLQSGLQQPIACPHLFAPCRHISQHASAGCFWSSNHQLNPADKVGKSGYNYFLMSSKHHYRMKDTVTNGFILHRLMKTLVIQAMAY